MNEQQLAIWGKDIVLLTFPDPGKYEHDNYRHGRIEETQPATHILRPDEEASKLAPVLEWSPFTHSKRTKTGSNAILVVLLLFAPQWYL